ncbi:MAG TPA: sulfur transferase domain-containing protein [Hyphomicrobium sp.]|nr:sulfur transferase domain-containing protein [Hyphomicrobium sp.]
MAGLLKRAKRSIRRKAGDWLHGAIHTAPDSLRARISPALCYFEMLILDYGIARVLYNNRHRISHEAWRSAQPAPHQIRHAARIGVKTVINLRGDQSFGTIWLEERACRQNGLTLVNFKLRSRAAPSRQELHAIRDMLGAIEYPVLIHCKSGADRAGLMSALYRHVREGVPIEQAKKELSLRYGHIRQADTGVLDHFFERYLADNARQPMEFWEWVGTRYDENDVNRSFKAKPIANRLVNTILARE